MECARICYEAKGVKRTTISEIMREAHLTREVVYYYFANKDEITSWVLESYVDDALREVGKWCDAWDERAARGGAAPFDIVADALRRVRRFVFDDEGTYRPSFAVIDEVGMHQKYLSAVCNEAIERYQDRPAVRLLRRTLSFISDQQYPYALKLFLMGTIGLMESVDEREDANIANLFLSVLRTVGQTEPLSQAG